jgi:pimeloyl-ACP methyl ester carboxylesterase
MAMWTLARWLGPWADATKVPVVESHDDAVADLRVKLYEPRRAGGRAFLIAPGLHYAGADDPRLDRFCRILAAAGHRVIAPFIPDYLALAPTARAIADFRRVAAELGRWTDRPPVVFSISFGSLLAFALAAEQPDLAERLVIFGGYADFRDTLRFCLTGEVTSGRAAPRDPMNQPVVLLNLLDQIAHDPALRPALEAGWRAYVERVWGRPEMKLEGRYLAVGEELAPSIPEAIRELFLVGIGVRPGAWPLVDDALGRATAITAALDPTPYLARVRGRVDLVHGTDDDVIPYEHAHQLAAQLAEADVRVHITGLYNHTGAAGGRLASMPRELATMLRVLRVLG